MKMRKALAAAAVALTSILGAPAAAQAVVNPDQVIPLVPAPHSPDGIPSSGVGPEFHTFGLARAYAENHLGVAPRGVNDFTCKVKAGDRPIVLIPGTGEDAFATWSFYAPHLANEGYCVYTFNTNVPVGLLDEGWAFTGDIRSSAQFLGSFVDRVRQATGSDKVDLIGHSQGGGILPNTYITMYGGASKVDKMIGLVASNHGTTAMGMDKLISGMSDATQTKLSAWADSKNLSAYGQQLKGSSLMAQVFGNGDTVPGVTYTVISTKMDEVVTPYTQAFLHGATNLTVQNVCPLDTYDHLRFSYDPVAYQLTLNALDPAHPREVACGWLPQYLPGTTTAK